MAYLAKDISINGNGKFAMVAGVDNVIQKIEKQFIPLLGYFVGQKSAVALGNSLGSVRLIDNIKDIYLSAQANADNAAVYDNDDTVLNIDSVVITQINPTEVQFSFRVVMPSNSVIVQGTLPISSSGV